ncbi:hypothetical protein TRICHSKD4_5964 [Roseibium sp. TrichSKD4]|nr:hypothetical protein TRICHSKD4_5964 [Roseibium sp. TrichSKD4]
MDDFYAARSRIIPPLPWSNFAPPISTASGPDRKVPEVEHQTHRTAYAEPEETDAGIAAGSHPPNSPP